MLHINEEHKIIDRQIINITNERHYWHNVYSCLEEFLDAMLEERPCSGVEKIEKENNRVVFSVYTDDSYDDLYEDLNTFFYNLIKIYEIYLLKSNDSEKNNLIKGKISNLISKYDVIPYDSELRVVRQDEFNKRYPRKAIEYSKEYAIIYSVYSKLFRRFLYQKLNLDTYESMIINSKLSFSLIDSLSEDFYQRMAHDTSKFFYLRNNIYVERLTDEEKRFLINIYKNGNYTLTEEVINFLLKTYEKVIAEEILLNNKAQYFYEDDVLSANPDELVIGFACDNYSLGSEAEADLDLRKEIDRIIEIMKKDFVSKLNGKIKIIVFDSYSVFALADGDFEYDMEQDSQ